MKLLNRVLSAVFVLFSFEASFGRIREYAVLGQFFSADSITKSESTYPTTDSVGNVFGLRGILSDDRVKTWIISWRQ